MIKLTCIDETGQDDYPFKIVKGESYEPMGCRQKDGIWFFLIYPYPFMFVWYEERMFDVGVNKYVKLLVKDAITENVHSMATELNP